MSNAFGTGPISIGPVHLARSAGGGAISPATDHLVLFDGHSTVTIAKGAEVLSDPVEIVVGSLEDLSISMYLKGSDVPSTIHGDARQTAYLAQGGDATARITLPKVVTEASRYFITDVLVETDAGARSIVILGDSISDGDRSTQDKNARWPDVLASRLRSDPRLSSIAVVNSGISGNRLLNAGPVGPSMMQRFAHDALDKEGVRWIVLEAGLNDVGLSDDPSLPGSVVSAKQVIAGMKTLIGRAHEKG
ncbi:MAG TPA: SGNH/GDSL hydrolase family protein, partial [Janthinobacterium sp.]|nr:SGNH/GDSL hydrolase family protein [Janthinobacterium sp.]